MNKGFILATIKNKEQELYAELTASRHKFGEDAESTTMWRHKWATIYDLCIELGIETIESGV